MDSHAYSRHPVFNGKYWKETKGQCYSVIIKTWLKMCQSLKVDLSISLCFLGNNGVGRIKYNKCKQNENTPRFTNFKSI